ncbi:MAG: cupin-like domain-containing protein [Nitrococcus sp.]|nr:cupin-like domain-containing protein [Nitrococcus sp.]
MSDLLVERVSGLDGRTMYHDYVEQLRPVILTDATASWPAHGKWSLAWLREKLGSREILLDGEMVQIGPLLDAILASDGDAPAPYLRNCYLSESMPELLPDVSPLPGDAHNRLRARGLPLPPKMRGRQELLVAGRGRHYPVLHYDAWYHHSFVTQLQGSKTFWLYNSDQGQYLYPLDHREYISRIDAFDPVDLTRWPDYAKARWVEVVVHPGETIFLPSGFWHRTRCEELSIAVLWSAVSKVNWENFISDLYLGPGGKAWRRPLKQFYLKLLDWSLRPGDARRVFSKMA